MDLRDFVGILRRSWALILAVTVFCVAVGLSYALLKSPEYSASTRVFVSTQSAGSVADLNQGSTFTQQVVESYADIITTPLVLEPVIADLDLDTTAELLAQRVTGSVALNTVVITISATDESPNVAAEIANSAATSFTQVVGELSPTTGGEAEPVRVTVVQTATAPLSPASPNLVLDLLIGLVIGLPLGFAIALARKLADTRIHGITDVAAITDSPVLGGIAFDPSFRKNPLIVRDDPRSPRAESFRSLRTNLQFLGYGGRSKSFVFTSAIEGEGKTTTVANLAIALVDDGASVALIDADLRRPRVAEVLGLEGAVGLSDVLIGRASLEDSLQSWGSGGLHVLPAGQIPPNPSELLGSDVMSNLVKTLTERYDIVLIDAPPLLPVSDAAIVSKHSGGAIVVAAARKTQRHQLRRALEVLTLIGADVMGVVVTMLPTKGSDTYGYGYGGAGYGYGHGESRTTK